MFTGIVEEVGFIQEMKQVSDSAMEISIRANKVLQDVQIGDSIAVNGVCLTVTTFTEDSFQVDVMPETVKATSLRKVTPNSPVNLERAMQATARFGGHFVTGHVDGIGTIVHKESSENTVYYDIRLDDELLAYFIVKGSVAVDGISLTVFGVNEIEKTVTISLIPHTLAVTNIGVKEAGDIVNIECDMLAKHVQHYMENMLHQKAIELKRVNDHV